MDKALKYELSIDEANFLLSVLNKAQFSGVQTAEAVLALSKKLQNPLNKEDLDKEQYEALKQKFEKPEKK